MADTIDDPMRLLERSAEIAAVEESLVAASAGAGSTLLLEGPAGIGKTALLDEAQDRARALGFTVLFARGGPLERDLAYGIVAQLLERVVRQADAAVVDGAAALARSVFFPDEWRPNNEVSADLRGPVVHGLYWLTANLAATSPVLVAIDDLQWSDPASVRFLVHLARRLDGLPIVVVATARSGDAAWEHEEGRELTGTESVRILRPRPFSKAAVEEIVRSELPGEPDREFVDACLTATGGVPFLVRELVDALASSRVAPSASSAGLVERVTSETVGPCFGCRAWRSVRSRWPCQSPFWGEARTSAT